MSALKRYEDASHRIPGFPDHKTQPMSGRILFSLLLRQKITPHEVGLADDTPRFLAHVRELQALGWPLYPPRSYPNHPFRWPWSRRSCTTRRCREMGAAFRDSVVRSPAGAAWVDAMSAEVLAGCAR